MGSLLRHGLHHDYSAEQRAMIGGTAAGMAHWAGTGPVGKTCRECEFLYGVTAFGAERYPPRDAGELRARRCHKRTLLSGVEGEPIHPSSSACRYFVENPKPPAMHARRSSETIAEYLKRIELAEGM